MIRPQIAVTGIGLVSRLGCGQLALRNALRPPPCDAPAGPPFVSEDFIDPNRMRRMDELSVWAVAAAHQARRDAGWAEDRADDVGICFGTAFGAQATTVRYATKLVEQGAYFTSPIDFPDSIDGAPAAHVAIELGLGGPSTTYVDGALSAELALDRALADLRQGRAQRMLVGAGDMVAEPITDVLVREGRTCGEESSAGVAVLALEDASRARRRGARIHAELAAFRHAFTPGCPVGELPREAEAIEGALRELLGAADLEATSVAALSGREPARPDVPDPERDAWRRVAGEGARRVDYGGAFGGVCAGGALRLAVACVVAPFRPGWLIHHTLSLGGQSAAVLIHLP